MNHQISPDNKKQPLYISKLEALCSPHCQLCLQPRDNTQLYSSYYCRHCYHALPWIESACQICSTPLDSSLALCCAHCQQQPPSYDRSLCLWQFNDDVRALIHAFKYQGRLDFGKSMSFELAKKYLRHRQASHALPEIIIPVPLHPKRLRARGFNQAQEIAQQLSRHLGIAYSKTLLTRTVDTPQQHQLSAAARTANVQHAFAIKQPIHYRHIAIVDDVITTTSTISAISDILKPQVQSIEVWSLAKTC